MNIKGIFKALGGLAIIGGGLLLGDKGKDIFVNGSHEAKKKDDEEEIENEIIFDYDTTDETTDNSNEE